MTGLDALRDDGPLARWIARLFRGAEPGSGWLVTPLVRALEFSGLIALTATAEPDALPWCFALLAVLAFRLYDTAYRASAGRGAQPRWVALAGGGWELRLLAAGALAGAGLLDPGLAIAAIALGALYVGEAAASWLRAGAGGSPGARVAVEPETLD
jgi:Family of unknown function (DUF5941)